MWASITAFILRNRLTCLAVILGITAFMGYKAREVRLSFDFPQVVPLSDPDFQYYQQFKKQFGEDGDLLIIGFQSKDIFKRDLFNSWMKLSQDVKQVKGVKGVASLSNLPMLEKDTAQKKFALRPLLDRPLATQQEADSIHRKIVSLPFYRNLFYNDSSHATLMAVKLDSTSLHSKDRIRVLNEVQKLADAFGSKHKLQLAYTGLPYIRTTFAGKIQRELNLFLVISVLVTSAILMLFYRSLWNVLFTMILIAVIIVWTLGITGMLGYKLTLLTGLIPPLIVIIAVPNFVYFLSRYHIEYRKYGNKLRGIIMMAQGIAKVVFLNNTTTAIGFGVLYFVDSPVLKEFGIVAFLMIVVTYVITLFLMPILFSFMPAPTKRHTHHLSNKNMTWFVEWIIGMVLHKRAAVYLVALGIGAIAAIGVTRLHALGYIMDDIPQRDRLYTDLKFFETNFKGVMPFEITINTGRKRGVLDLDNMARMEQLQDSLAAMPEFANSISVVNLAKYASQAYFGGRPSRYVLPSPNDLTLMGRYLRSFKMAPGGNGGGVGFQLADSNMQTARITTKMADVGSERLDQIVKKLDRIIPQIFNDSTAEHKVTHRFTGFSRIFLKGNSFLIEHLTTSLISAILLIMIVLALLFPSVRLVTIVLVPNVLALLITAGIMGLLNIPLKPSSVLVFSIAFGIGIDASFHFLMVYRQDLRQHNWNIPKTIAISLRETGASIIYSSLVLFFGFGIFCFSTFGSTITLGALTSITLICAMFTNMILLPALLVSFDRKSKRKTRFRHREE